MTDANAAVYNDAEAVDADNLPFVPQHSEEAEAASEEQDSEDSEFNEEESDENESTDVEGNDLDEALDTQAFSFAEIGAETNEATAATDATAATAAVAAGAEAAAVPAIVAPAPRGFKFHPERVVEAQTTNKFEDPEMGKLNLALAAVKEDILSTNKQIIDERKWVIAVAKIIASYNDKMKRVEAHIIALRKEMKQLYKKKKQIENLKLQKALEAKLKEARDELATLTTSLKHVASKQGELNRSGRDLRDTISGIMAQLAKLRGQQIRPRPAPLARRGAKKCKKGMRFSKKAKKCVKRKSKLSKKL